MEVPWQSIAIGCAAALAALGIAVTLVPKPAKPGLGRALVVMGFVMLAVGYGVAESQSSSETAAIQRKILEGTTGGENYGYVQADMRFFQSNDQLFPIVFFSTGLMFDINIKISPWDKYGDASTKEYQEGPFIGIDKANRGFLMFTNLRLAMGDYRVEITAKNGHFVQRLFIAKVDGVPQQTIKVMADGDTLFESSMDIPQ